MRTQESSEIDVNTVLNRVATALPKSNEVANKTWIFLKLQLKQDYLKGTQK